MTLPEPHSRLPVSGDRTPRRRRPRPHASARVLRSIGVVALAALLALTACSTPAQRFDDAVGQGLAAVETARLAIEQQADERVFTTVTTTALADARRELLDAVTSVSETDAVREIEAARRTDVLEALRSGLDAVNDARDAMAGLGSLDASADGLEDAAAALAALERRASGATSGERR
jgi:hypothetical protein